MRNPGGYAVITDPDNGITEFDTLTCCHCQRIMHTAGAPESIEVGDMCRLCMKYQCRRCTSLDKCAPFEKKLERYEKATRFHAAVGTVLRVVVFMALFYGIMALAGKANAAELYLSWNDDSTDETHFQIERSDSPDGAYTTVTNTAADATSYRDTGLTAGEQYCYRISACNAEGCSSPTSPQCQRPLILPIGHEIQ
jgi:hypothetical protein